MNNGAVFLVSILLSSLVPGLLIFGLREESVRMRTILNLAGACLKLTLVILMDIGIYNGNSYEMSLPLMPGIVLLLRADSLSALFATLSSLLWLLTTVYAVGYLEQSPNRSHFFGYFSLCVTVTIGIALAGNLVTFLLFYELLTLTTYPLIIHRGTTKALRAGRNYLIYTFCGGAVFLYAVIWLQTLLGPIPFSSAGIPAAMVTGQDAALKTIFILLILGIGVKAALVPLHGWLPQAMIAPAPVSALLHAVAVVKAGAFGITRVVLDVYGYELLLRLHLLPLLTAMAALTILYGSLRALQQDDLKRRLAYSTVSQVSYITLGISLAGSPEALTGGLVHLVHQGLMKITLFFCAGNLAETLGVHRISEMHGVGRRMPLTMAAFSIGALGMIGIPPTAGFVSKWFLVLGSLQTNHPWLLVMLLLSTCLNAGYFLPILTRSWLDKPPESWPHEARPARLETDWMLLLPPLVTSALVLLVGVLANAGFSPLAWVRFLVHTYGF